MKKCSVLGCGWLGFALALKLIEKGYEVNGSVRTSEKLAGLKSQRIKPYLIDLSDDTVPIPKDFLDCDNLIVCIPEKSTDAHRRLIERLEDSRIKQILFTSSTSVYNVQDGLAIEGSPLKESPLVQIEQLYRTAIVPVCILRLGGLIGPDRHPGRFFRKRIETTLTNAPTNLVHREMVLDAILYFLENKPLHNVYNVISDEHPPNFDFYSTAVEDLSGMKARFKKGEGRKGKFVSNKRIKKETGLDFSLRKYISYLEGEK